MRKLIAAINMTINGFCDHTAGVPDEALHRHYENLLNSSDAILYGRITYQLMEYWRPFVEKPSGEPSMDEFAKAMDRITKIVFSRTLTEVDWKTAKLASQDVEKEARQLKQQAGRDILVGSPGLINRLTPSGLIDEYQLCVHPVIAGGGLPLFKNLNDTISLQLLQTKTFDSGAVILYYKQANSIVSQQKDQHE